MKPAYSRPTRGDEERTRLFDRFPAFGFQGLQLKASQYRDFVDAPNLFLEQFGDQSGIASGLIYWGALDEAGIEATRQLIRFAARVGSERVVFCHNTTREGLTDELLRSYVHILGALGDEAEHLGVTLSLHNHYGQPVMLADEIARFFDLLRRPSVKLTVDTAHLAKAGVWDLAGVIRRFKEVIDNVHLKDYADGEWRTLGQGKVDLPSILEALKDIRYDGWLCVDEESGFDLDHSLRQSYALIEPWL